MYQRDECLMGLFSLGKPRAHYRVCAFAVGMYILTENARVLYLIIMYLYQTPHDVSGPFFSLSRLIAYYAHSRSPYVRVTYIYSYDRRPTAGCTVRAQTMIKFQSTAVLVNCSIGDIKAPLG